MQGRRRLHFGRRRVRDRACVVAGAGAGLERVVGEIKRIAVRRLVAVEAVSDDFFNLARPALLCAVVQARRLGGHMDCERVVVQVVESHFDLQFLGNIPPPNEKDYRAANTGAGSIVAGLAKLIER